MPMLNVKITQDHFLAHVLKDSKAMVIVAKISMNVTPHHALRTAPVPIRLAHSLAIAMKDSNNLMESAKMSTSV